jgi:hypothetical protein
MSDTISTSAERQSGQPMTGKPGVPSLGGRCLQRAGHDVNVLLDGVDHGAGGARVALVSEEFAGEILGQIADAFQARDQWPGWRTSHTEKCRVQL